VSSQQWYWCLNHERAEAADSPCPPDRRLGPYPSRDAAEHWKESFDARNESWDKADREWEGEES
jgi:hypothetical protein